MRREARSGLRAYRFETLPGGVDALVSTRVVDLPGDAERFFAAFGLPPAAWCEQVHGNGVAVATEPATYPGADALVTDVCGLPLAIRHADCVPIVLYDPERHAVGVAHAGWRGTVARIASRTVAALRERYGSDPAALVCALGPSIAPDDYEVGPEVIAAARRAYGDAPVLRGANFDLWAANALDLASAGVRRIEVTGVPTGGSDFFSYRADGPGTGRLATIAMLRADHPARDSVV
ncbi:MAG TPA: peptidoglycan editing factor PgeF [Solirubrobacter sp.]|nr:peptidoglycan editing factor PgeF [Solirubrobacter sp.]